VGTDCHGTKSGGPEEPLGATPKPHPAALDGGALGTDSKYSNTAVRAPLLSRFPPGPQTQSEILKWLPVIDPHICFIS
jgi:hypothetical protein